MSELLVIVILQVLVYNTEVDILSVFEFHCCIQQRCDYFPCIQCKCSLLQFMSFVISHFLMLVKSFRCFNFLVFKKLFLP